MARLSTSSSDRVLKCARYIQNIYIMNVKKCINPYANLRLHDQLYRESRAMAEYALANGNSVPSSIIMIIEAFESRQIQEGSISKANAEQMVEHLIASHDTLSTIISPAKPRTILLLDMEQETSSFWRFLGPVALVRQMMIAALLSVALFFITVLSPYVNTQGGNILNSDGIPLLYNLLFFVAAAGLGASFSALYTANEYITKCTFDPAYQASYWIRFFLGLISGLVLSVVISENAFKDGTGGLLEEGIIRPLLAMLGGFSADLFYTFLNRFVETSKSLFQGSASSAANAKIEETKSRMATSQVQNQIKLATKLMNAQQEISKNENRAQYVKQTLDNLIEELMADMKSAQQ